MPTAPDRGVPFSNHWYAEALVAVEVSKTDPPWQMVVPPGEESEPVGTGLTSTEMADEVASQPADDATFTLYDPAAVAVNEAAVAPEIGAPPSNHW